MMLLQSLNTLTITEYPFNWLQEFHFIGHKKFQIVANYRQPKSLVDNQKLQPNSLC